jgi:hypothetical protein
LCKLTLSSAKTDIQEPLVLLFWEIHLNVIVGVTTRSIGLFLAEFESLRESSVHANGTPVVVPTQETQHICIHPLQAPTGQQHGSGSIEVVAQLQLSF